MTPEQTIESMLADGVTTSQAAAATGTTVSHCQKILTGMVRQGLAHRHIPDDGSTGVTWVYTKDYMGARVDIGSSMRAMMITKAWKPGELRL